MKRDVHLSEIPEAMTGRVKEKLNQIGTEVDKRIPEGWGFAVLVFPFGNADEDRTLMYVSNAERANIVEAFKEWIQKAGIN